MAAVCQPDAARPLNTGFSAAASSKGNGCGSNSAANRFISSVVTLTSPVLKRIPNARSSNHSIILPCYATANGYQLVGEFYDAAVSGADPIAERKGFAALLDRIEGNGVRTVI